MSPSAVKTKPDPNGWNEAIRVCIRIGIRGCDISWSRCYKSARNGRGTNYLCRSGACRGGRTNRRYLPLGNRIQLNHDEFPRIRRHLNTVLLTRIFINNLINSNVLNNTLV